MPTKGGDVEQWPEKLLNAEIQRPGRVFVWDDPGAAENPHRTGEWLDGVEVDALLVRLTSKLQAEREAREEAEAKLKRLDFDGRSLTITMPDDSVAQVLGYIVRTESGEVELMQREGEDLSVRDVVGQADEARDAHKQAVYRCLDRLAALRAALERVATERAVHDINGEYETSRPIATDECRKLAQDALDADETAASQSPVPSLQAHLDSVRKELEAALAILNDTSLNHSHARIRAKSKLRAAASLLQEGDEG